MEGISTANKLSSCRGCLLGLAVGDALGYPVDDLPLEEIRRCYGPNGLLGYDLVNGYAGVSSYTQIAAYSANGLLLGLTHGQLHGRMAPFVHYIDLALREWARMQHTAAKGDVHCYLSRLEPMRRRRCADLRLADTLNCERSGSVEEPANRLCGPGALTAAVPVCLALSGHRLRLPEADRLGAEAVALVTGGAAAFLPGAVLTHLLSQLLHAPERPLPLLIAEALDALDALFGREFSEPCAALRALLRQALLLAQSDDADPNSAMEQLGCRTGTEVLAGALYACLSSRGDFDAAIITAVNHSGHSAAVASVTGALMGTWLGEGGIPDFYLESLEPYDILRTLASDLAAGCPMERSCGMFDDDWNQKYVHAEPVAPGWDAEM